jgi:hypothetical protein
MLVRADVRRVSALRHDARVGPHGTVGIQLMATIRLVVVLALAAHEARVGLGSYSYALAGLDERDFGPDAESCADDF